MGAPRRLAQRLLDAFANLAPPASREWARAMLGELDSIRGDWAALFWAVEVPQQSAATWQAIGEVG